jgi:peptidyl-prolyl cis-trans isomerase SurA
LGNKENLIVAVAFGVTKPQLWIAVGAAALAAASGALAQASGQTEGQPEQQPAVNTAQSLKLPENAQVFGNAMPSVIKATAIVNGEVITPTDIDQRVALLVVANGGQVAADELQRLRDQVLRNLIDETLQIQAAKQEKIDVKQSEIDRALQRVASNVKQTPEQLAAFLESRGSNVKTLRRQIEGELAWQRLQRAKIESGVTIGDDEVKAVLDKLNASKGTQEFRVGEIFLSASPATQAQTLDNANKILAQLRQGGSFAAYARQYSEASTAAVGGDLGWVRPEQLPTPLADALREMPAGAISNPIPVPGGFSILAVQDTRKILTADPRDAVLSLKQISVSFPQGTKREAAEPIITRFADAAQSVGGCGGADKLAAAFHAEVVSSDQVKMRDLPAALQQLMLPMQVGQATPPYGSVEDGIRVLVICGRDEPHSSAPSYDDVYNQLNEERVNSRAQRYLRDLRRDAVIEYR